MKSLLLAPGLVVFPLSLLVAQDAAEKGGQTKPATPPAPVPPAAAVKQEKMEIREWKVPWSLFTAAAAKRKEEKPDDEPLGPKDLLCAGGVTFAPGTLAIYSPTSETLTVKNTKTQLEAIEQELIKMGWQKPQAVKRVRK